MRPTLTVLAGPNGAGKSYFSDYFVQINLISTQPVNIDALEAQIDKSRIPNDPLRYGIEVIKAIDKVFQSLCQNAILNNKDFSFECFNIGTSYKILLFDLIKIIEKTLEKKAIIRETKRMNGDVLITQANISHAVELLGYSPIVNIDDGIGKQVQYMKETNK